MCDLKYNNVKTLIIQNTVEAMEDHKASDVYTEFTCVCTVKTRDFPVLCV